MKGNAMQLDARPGSSAPERNISDHTRELFFHAQAAEKNNRWQECILLYSKVIEQKPDLPQVYNNMGDAYRHLGNLDAALKCFHKALACDPEIATIHCNLGAVYHLRKAYSLAKDHFQRAVELQPDYANAWIGLALIHSETAKFDLAHDCLDRAVSIAPDLAEARWNRSAVLLLKGLLHQGWQDYEWRFKIAHHRALYPHELVGRRWDGAAAPEQTILVHDEQGLGDTIQFARYLPLVKRSFNRVIFETRKELVNLLSSFKGIDEIIIRNSSPAPSNLYDQYIPLMSLPGVLGSAGAHLTGKVPYIEPTRADRDYWHARLPQKKFKVGLVWAGRPEHANDANRSCPFEKLLQLVQMDGIAYIGLQKGPAGLVTDSCIDGNFTNWGPLLKDFTDTAGLLGNLDLLVTVDTSVAHLAGAMGRPVWVMLPFVPDWRWAISGSRTPWYPTMRLFRQPRLNDWPSVIDSVQNSLDHFIRSA